MLNEQSIAGLSIAEKVIEQIQISNTALEKAASAEERYNTAANNAKMLVPAALDALVANGCIQPDQREKAAGLLTNHAETVKLLAKVAAFKGQQPQTLGSPVVEKQASDANAMSAVDARFLATLAGE